MNLLENVTIHTGDALAVLRKLPSESVDCVVTSPPYWGLRDYKADGQLGLEDSPQEFIKRLVRVFRQVRRVLKNEGTCWLNIGDSYAGSWGGASKKPYTLSPVQANNPGSMSLGKPGPASKPARFGLKPKDLALIPARLAIALQADGWYLRNDIIWHKPNGMPSSVRDRFTQNHEYLFFLTKSARYYFDQDAVKEEAVKGAAGSEFHTGKTGVHQLGRASKKARSGNKARVYGVNAMNPALGSNIPWEGTTRNKRTVWEVATACYEGEHFAVFPPKLIEPCILAGCPGGGVVLDPFGGSGTTAGVAVAHGRKAILIDLNPAHNAQVPARIEQVVRSLRGKPAPKPEPKSQIALFTEAAA